MRRGRNKWTKHQELDTLFAHEYPEFSVLHVPAQHKFREQYKREASSWKQQYRKMLENQDNEAARQAFLAESTNDQNLLILQAWKELLATESSKARRKRHQRCKRFAVDNCANLDAEQKEEQDSVDLDADAENDEGYEEWNGLSDGEGDCKERSSNDEDQPDLSTADDDDDLKEDHQDH